MPAKMSSRLGCGSQSRAGTEAVAKGTEWEDLNCSLQWVLESSLTTGVLCLPSPLLSPDSNLKSYYESSWWETSLLEWMEPFLTRRVIMIAFTTALATSGYAHEFMSLVLTTLLGGHQKSERSNNVPRS